MGRELNRNEDHQRRRCLSAEDAGAGSPLHPGPPRTGYGPQTMGTEACRTRRKAGKESSGHCSGTKIRHLAAPAMGDGRSLRTPAKREHAALTEKASGVIKSGSLQIVEFG